MKRSKLLILLLTALLSSSLLASIALASHIETFTVPPRSTTFLTIPLQEQTKFNGSFSTTGNIRFFVTDPQRLVIANLGVIDNNATFAFAAKVTGNYTLNFENEELNSKDLSLNFNTDPEIPTNANPSTSLPLSELVTLITIAAMAVVLVLYFVLRRHKTNEKTEPSPMLPTKQGKIAT